jgi:hypothetical protein
MEVSGQLQAPAALPPGKEPLEAGWAPEPVWTQWWREKFPAPVGTQTPDHPVHSPVLYHWAVFFLHKFAYFRTDFLSLTLAIFSRSVKVIGIV